MSNNGNIPICPLISSGKDIHSVCAQESCAWYIHNLKTCAVYVMAHNALLDVKAKQGAKSAE